MITKNKPKSGVATKKSAKKKSSPRIKKETNPAQVRKDVSRMVESEAGKMAKAVIDEGKKGQLATVKYLFEMAAIYPAQADQASATADEDCFAKTLLHRLNIPDEPIRHEEDEEPKAAASGDSTDAKPADEGETKNLEPGLP
jgi:hypothetical protein